MKSWVIGVVNWPLMFVQSWKGDWLRIGDFNAKINALGGVYAPWIAKTGYKVHSDRVSSIIIHLSTKSFLSPYDHSDTCIWHRTFWVTECFLFHFLLFFTCLLCFMFLKVFTTISCFWMRYWSVIPLMNPHCYSLCVVRKSKGGNGQWLVPRGTERWRQTTSVSRSLTSPLNPVATWTCTQAHSHTAASTPAAKQSPDALLPLSCLSFCQPFLSWTHFFSPLDFLPS